MAFTQTYTVAIDRTKCGSSSLTNFPVRIFASHSSLKSTAHGGDITSANAYDLVVLADDGTLSTLLPWEIDSWDPVNGGINIWAQLPLVNGSAAGANTTFVVAWGDSGITTQQNVGSYAPANVWDSGYIMVIHFGDGTTLNLNDSTSYGNHGSDFNPGHISAASGVCGGGVFVDSSGGVRVPSTGPATNTPSGADLWTMSCWFTALLAGGIKFAMAVGSGSTTNRGAEIITFNGGVRGGLFNNFMVGAGTASIFHHVVVTYDGTQQHLFVDGVETSGSPDTQTANIDASLPIFAAGPALNGTVDEARVSKGIARSVDWALTEFHNQGAPGNIGSPDFLIWTSGATVSTGVQPQMFVMM